MAQGTEKIMEITVQIEGVEKQVVREWVKMGEPGEWTAHIFLTEDATQTVTEEQFVGIVFGQNDENGRRRFFSTPGVKVEKPCKKMKDAILVLAQSTARKSDFRSIIRESMERSGL